MRKINKYTVVTVNLFNVLLITSLVLLTKWLLTCVRLPCSTLLVLQCSTAFLGLIAYEKWNFFAIKTVHLDVILVLSVIFSLLVLFASISLKLNSIMLYYSVKLISGSVLVMFRKNTSLTIHKPLVLVVLGSFLNIVYDKNANVKDLYYGAIFLILSVFYQQFLKKKQREMRLELNQLMFYHLPLCGILFFPFMINHEMQTGFLLTRNWPLSDLLLILLTCIITFLSVLLTDYCSKHITNKQYSVLHHSQCTLTLILGIYIYEDGISLGQWFGIILIVFGNFLYDYYQWSKTFEWDRRQLNQRRNL